MTFVSSKLSLIINNDILFSVSGDMWTVTNVRRLLTLRLERETQFSFSQPKNRNMLWKQICDILNKENVPATPLQCSQKYRNLCTTYRNNKQKMTLR
ncbi:trihelix transcription factor GT-4-like [Diaphorina citri]|uniref:Trihelix transcription factor GT-4-like n=1 Tax=Diaphorina citri TaxID=121845 RepID=A0A3Q0J6H7_DIACI|nr:trihelix transcription factor GT-4-like [Diaphorina citri]